MLIHTIKLNNFLSFGDTSESVSLKPLNVIIGPNGTGKSNFLEAIGLLASAPEQLAKPVREGGGVHHWLWKGAKDTPVASLDVVVANPHGPQNLRYVLSFTEVGQRFEVVDEKVENELPFGNHPKPYFYYHFNQGRPTFNVKEGKRTLRQEEIPPPQESILKKDREPDQYPEITYLRQKFGSMKFYREWDTSRNGPLRRSQMADLPNDVLEPDASNLALMLNKLRNNPAVKHRLLEALQALYEGIDDYYVQIEGGTVQVFLHEGPFAIPAMRLSDGTLRYLCLLAILCNPALPPLVCIEEPELGLHPDVLPTLADLLREASERCQLIVTTHSDILVDALSDQPESVLVAEKTDQGTTLTRLDAEKLRPWLEKYRLGQLWTRGEIGGTRW